MEICKTDVKRDRVLSERFSFSDNKWKLSFHFFANATGGRTARPRPTPDPR